MKQLRESLCGYDIDLISAEEAYTFCFEQIEKNENVHIVTINPEMIELADKNKEFSEVLKSAELVLPDGIGIKIGFKIKGINIERIAGIDFTYHMLEIAEQKKYTVALVGARNDVLKDAVRNLKNKLPNIDIVYQRDGFFSEEEVSQIIESVEALSPKIVLVALGAPKQEIFINKLKEVCKGTIFVGVGGSFDVWAEHVKRAPVIFQKLGLEWLYRTIMQPSRFKRIFPTLPLFLFRVIMSLRK